MRIVPITAQRQAAASGVCGVKVESYKLQLIVF
jgi:hypothetical protein